MLVAPESPIFLEQKKALQKSEEDGPTVSCWGKRIGEVKSLFRIPLQSPEVYKPLVLILGITCLQHFSGFTFTKKFLLQVLAPQNKNMNSTSSNVTEIPGQSEDYTSYYFAMAINLLRFLANLLMARFLVNIRIRLLFFLSMFTTSICLATLAFLLHPLGERLVPQDVDLYLRVGVLALHVFSVQFGIQTLAGQMTDTLLPSHSKSILKGLIRSAQSISLFMFVSVMAFLPHPTAFWTMAAVLVLASPVLYVYIPELRSLGRAAGSLYFLPIQTKFYISIPRDGDIQPMTRFRNAGTSIIAALAFSSTRTNSRRRRTVSRRNRISFRGQMSVEERADHVAQRRNTIQNASEDKFATFGENTVEETIDDPSLKKENQLSVTLIKNMLPGANNYLANHHNEDRILVARGPATFSSGVGAFFKCGVFLFTDILVVAQKVKKNRKYVNPRVFNLDPSFTVERQETTLTFANKKSPCSIVLEPEAKAKMWEKFVKFCVFKVRTQIAGDTSAVQENGWTRVDLS